MTAPVRFPNSIISPEQKKLLMKWEADLRIICHAHYDAAVAASKNNYKLGIPVIILSAIVGTAIFSSLEKSPQTYIVILVGLISILNVVLASLQTFLKWSERAEKHRDAGARFGALLKEIEQKIALPFSNVNEFENWANSFRIRWDELSIESPTVPKSYWDKHLLIEKERLKEEMPNR